MSVGGGHGNYDYVVVGAGSAGCAVAARLSEDAGIHVAVLEAGSRQVPPWSRKTSPSPGIGDWFRTRPSTGRTRACRRRTASAGDFRSRAAACRVGPAISTR